eukprot:m.444323 g.444323  ORF g.444323 m.444323 type:complete len:259 (-) comp20296_c11_seq14:480-1256(-)
MTLCAAQSADHNMLPFGYIVEGKIEQESWFAPPYPPGVPAWRNFQNVPVMCTPKGFTTSEVHPKMVMEVCIKPLRNVFPSGPLLIITDNPTTHSSSDIERVCQDNDCILLTLPSNTSHVLQPLDVHGFNIFKNTFFALIENIHTVYSSPYFFLSELDLSLQQYHHGQSPENQFYRALNIEHNLSPRTQPLATNTHFCGRAGLLETASLAPDGGIRAHGFVSARPRKGHHQQRSFAPTRQPPRNPWAPPRTTEAFRKAG